MPLGLARVLRRPLAVVVEAPEEQFGAWLGGVLGVLQVAEHLFQVALVGIVVEQLGQADPGRGVARRDLFQQRLGGLRVGLAEFAVGEHPGHRVDPLAGHPAGLVGGAQLFEQDLLLFRVALHLVDRGQFVPAHIHAPQPALADLLDLAQVLGVGALGAVEDDLRQVGLRQSARAPLVDALLRVDFRPGLRVLQVEHDERHQGTVLARFEGLAE